ncbi:MAG: sensor histidine kinase [Sphingobium sp.]
MNQARTLQHIAALALVAAGVISAEWLGTRLEVLAIFLIVSLLLFLLLRDNPSRSAIADPMAAPSFDPPDLVAMAGFRSIVEGLSEPVLVVEHGKVTLANSSARKLLGAHILGEDARLAIRHPAAAERLSSAEMPTQPVRIDIIGLGNRNQRWAMGIIPFGQEEERQRLFVYLTDESGLHAAERLRGDFVANASHELRTPLAAILGFVETLQDPETGGDTQTRERFLSILQKEARRMQQLVDDLMSLSRIEADKYRLPETPIEMPALVDEVLSLCRQNLGDRGHDIIAAISDDIPATQGDRTQISQLLHNLVSNSAKYGRPGTPITVRLAPAPPSMIRLEVCDEGEGIPSDHLPRLTERFYRVDSGRSRAIGGTGLGLAIVKHIVERHRGRLDISSTAGKGTTVSVLLPSLMPETMDNAKNSSSLNTMS